MGFLGWTETPLGKFAGFQNIPIAEIPGLGAIPIKDVAPIGLGSITGFLRQGGEMPTAIVDNVLGVAEGASTFKVISGSEKAGFNVPCTEGPCPYIELADPEE